MKLKLLGLTIAAINVCNCLSAQSIYFEYSDGTNSSYAIDDVRKITFTDDIMNLHLHDGSSYSWDVESIDHYQYELNPLQIDAILQKVNSMEVHVHPNPVDNNLIVSYINKENIYRRKSQGPSCRPDNSQMPVSDPQQCTTGGKIVQGSALLPYKYR